MNQYTQYFGICEGQISNGLISSGNHLAESNRRDRKKKRTKNDEDKIKD
jgi:hypothetical protein